MKRVGLIFSSFLLVTLSYAQKSEVKNLNKVIEEKNVLIKNLKTSNEDLIEKLNKARELYIDQEQKVKALELIIENCDTATKEIVKVKEKKLLIKKLESITDDAKVDEEEVEEIVYSERKIGKSIIAGKWNDIDVEGNLVIKTDNTCFITIKEEGTDAFLTNNGKWKILKNTLFIEWEGPLFEGKDEFSLIENDAQEILFRQYRAKEKQMLNTEEEGRATYVRDKK